MSRGLWTIAVLLWVISIAFVFWVDSHRDHPYYTVFGIGATVLIAVLTPATFGAAVSWPHALTHRRRISSAWAGALTEWAFLALAPFVMFFRFYDESIYLLQHPDKWTLNSHAVFDFVFPPVLFGLVGAIMGFVGGAIAMRVRRRLAS